MQICILAVSTKFATANWQNVPKRLEFSKHDIYAKYSIPNRTREGSVLAFSCFTNASMLSMCWLKKYPDKEVVFPSGAPHPDFMKIINTHANQQSCANTYFQKPIATYVFGVRDVITLLTIHGQGQAGIPYTFTKQEFVSKRAVKYTSLYSSIVICLFSRLKQSVTRNG